MALWQRKETTLTEHEKAAYRYLLYQAMLDIRMLCQSRGEATWNPREIWRQYRRSRTAGAIADWLHNLAQYSVTDFRGFDAKEFWQEYDGLRRKFKQVGPRKFIDYRRRYAEYLAREDTQ